jgi:hypothetical protein
MEAAKRRIPALLNATSEIVADEVDEETTMPIEKALTLGILQQRRAQDRGPRPLPPPKRQAGEAGPVDS